MQKCYPISFNKLYNVYLINILYVCIDIKVIIQQSSYAFGLYNLINFLYKCDVEQYEKVGEL